MKMAFRRDKKLLWIIPVLLVGLVAVIWSWSRVAQFYATKELHSVLVRETAAASPALTTAGFTVTSVDAPMCVHPSGLSVWLVDIGCQNFSQLKPNQSLVEAQASYIAGADKFAATLKKQGWSPSGPQIDPAHPELNDAVYGVVYAKKMSSVDCRLMISFRYDSSAIECDKSVKVPVLPIPYFYEYYGGG